MQVHPDVARLRSGEAPQPCCQAMLAAWRGLPEVAAVMAALARFDAGEPLDGLPALARVIADHTAALAFATEFITPLIAALRAEPLAQLLVGHSAGPGMARLRLATYGRAGLTLIAFARRERAVSPSALFEDCEVREIILAGAAQALLHRLAGGGQLTTEEIACIPGTRLKRDGTNATRQIIAVTRPLLALQLTREAVHPAPSREIALDDGRLIKTISGCKVTSQQMMALGVLGALQHRPALHDMEQVASDRERERNLRWEALRQVLAMDAARGLALLARIADSAGDPLTAPAAALRRDLVTARPDLAALHPEPA
jgi:hypothetical protein